MLTFFGGCSSFLEDVHVWWRMSWVQEDVSTSWRMWHMSTACWCPCREHPYHKSPTIDFFPLTRTFWEEIFPTTFPTLQFSASRGGIRMILHFSFVGLMLYFSKRIHDIFKSFGGYYFFSWRIWTILEDLTFLVKSHKKKHWVLQKFLKRGEIGFTLDRWTLVECAVRRLMQAFVVDS